jgi:hypothetical protein
LKDLSPLPPISNTRPVFKDFTSAFESGDSFLLHEFIKKIKTNNGMMNNFILHEWS